MAGGGTGASVLRITLHIRDRAGFWRAALLLLAVGFVYWPAVHGSWLWDDDLEITRNPVLRDPLGWWKIWLRPDGADYFPLKETVQWLEWRVWGSNSTVYHVTNVVLHAAGALLVWRLLRRLFPRTGEGGIAAWWGGLLFAVHPLAVESVAWISELKNTLSLPLLLLAMIAYLDWDERSTRGSYVWSVGLFAAAMLAKTSVVMLPAVLLLHALWRRGRIAPRDLLASIPFFAISLALGLATVRFQHGQFVLPGGPPVGGAASRIACAGMAVAFYLWKALIPVGLLPVYPSWVVEPARAWQFLPWAGLVLVIGRLWTARGKWGRDALLGFGFFLLNLVPVLGLIRMSFARFSWVADHFAYIPLVGLVGLAAAAFGAVLGRLQGRGRAPVLAAGAVVVVTLVFIARSQAALFHDPTALWTRTISRNPAAWVADYNLGCELVAQNRPAEAIGRFEETLRLNPVVPEAENGLGTTLAQMNRPGDAVEHLARAVQIYPRFGEAEYNLGSALLQEERFEEAIVHFEAALRDGMRTIDLLSNLGLALAHAGRLEEAVGRYREALQIDPSAVTVHDNLGSAQLLLGRPAEAISEFNAALRLQPGDADAHFGLGNALVMERRMEEAVAQYAEALRIRPDFAAARQNLDAARQELGQSPRP
jgi:protein O-mannosyl-transferase